MEGWLILLKAYRCAILTGWQTGISVLLPRRLLLPDNIVRVNRVILTFLDMGWWTKNTSGLKPSTPR